MIETFPYRSQQQIVCQKPKQIFRNFYEKTAKAKRQPQNLSAKKKQQEQQQCKAQTKFMHFEKFLTTPRGAL